MPGIGCGSTRKVSNVQWAANSKEKRSAVVRLAPLLWRVSLRHQSVFVPWKILLFSFEATIDLVLSVV